VQTYFRKVVSNHWQKSVEEIHTYDENKINRVYNEFAGSSFGGVMNFIHNLNLCRKYEQIFFLSYWTK
jgi:hypothetical protein